MKAICYKIFFLFVLIGGIAASTSCEKNNNQDNPEELTESKSQVTILFNNMIDLLGLTSVTTKSYSPRKNDITQYSYFDGEALAKYVNTLNVKESTENYLVYDRTIYHLSYNGNFALSQYDRIILEPYDGGLKKTEYEASNHAPEKIPDENTTWEKDWESIFIAQVDDVVELSIDGEAIFTYSKDSSNTLVKTGCFSGRDYVINETSIVKK